METTPIITIIKSAQTIRIFLGLTPAVISTARRPFPCPIIGTNYDNFEHFPKFTHLPRKGVIDNGGFLFFGLWLNG